MDVSVRSDLYEAGVDGDGSPYIAEVYRVVLREADGRQFYHYHEFPGCKPVFCDESMETFFVDVREEAVAGAEALAARVVARGAIDPKFWAEGDPAYGSDAYEALVGGMSSQQLADY